jgi:hypothetical protein
MKCLIFLLFTGALFAGCAADWTQQAKANCLNYGHDDQSVEFSQCVQVEALVLDQRNMRERRRWGSEVLRNQVRREERNRNFLENAYGLPNRGPQDPMAVEALAGE